jgi:Ser/Thr protein kinase RdoA (MazF antagonist)
VLRAAAPITEEIVKAIARLDDPRQPRAETARRVAAYAEERGLTRPSYEALRPLIKLYRHLQARPSALELFLDASLVGWTRGIGDELLKPRAERRPRR